MCASDKQTATENVTFWCFIVEEKTQKNLRGVGKKKIYKPHIPALNDWLGLWEGRSLSISELFWRVTIK